MTEGTPPPSRPGSGGARRRILVLACGEASRGDDAAAFLAAELLRARLADAGGDAGARGLDRDGGVQGPGARVDVRSVGQLGPDHLLDLGSDDAVVVIDAVRGVPAGSIVRRPLADLAAGGPAPRSSHMFPLRDVLALVATLRGGLPAGTFVGLGGAAFELGDGLSPAVRAALPAFVAVIVEEAERLDS